MKSFFLIVVAFSLFEKSLCINSNPTLLPTKIPSVRPNTGVPTTCKPTLVPSKVSSIAPTSNLICQFGSNCNIDNDCVPGNKCSYGTCLPDPSKYYNATTTGCISSRNYSGAGCSISSQCCDPGAFCNLDPKFPFKVCQQPDIISGGCSTYVYNPTLQPSPEPTGPTFGPTEEPTLLPTVIPSDPTFTPTQFPTDEPISRPTLDPTFVPTSIPSGPSMQPSAEPTSVPVSTPSEHPSQEPAEIGAPSEEPTPLPPTASPTETLTLCQYAFSCTSDRDCRAGNKCNAYHVCVPDPTQYKDPAKTACIPNYDESRVPCIAGLCCDPGAFCDPVVSLFCRQPDVTDTINYFFPPNIFFSRPMCSGGIFAPSIKPVAAPTPTPSIKPTPSPTTPSTFGPTTNPSKQPSQGPTMSPTKLPSKCPTINPTKQPSKGPTFNPSQQPTKSPTSTPSKQPVKASSIPSVKPTASPTSKMPTAKPTGQPVKSTAFPTRAPSKMPSNVPTTAPTTKVPTAKVTCIPTTPPTRIQTSFPSKQPTKVTTPSPTTVTPICQYGGYCRLNSNCFAGNKCQFQNQFYSQCLPDPTTYSSVGCIANFAGKCTSSSKCCDPGSYCDLSLPFPQCHQPAAPSGLCINPVHF